MPFLTKTRLTQSKNPASKNETTKAEQSAKLVGDNAAALLNEHDEYSKKLRQKQELLRRLNLVKAYKSRVCLWFYFFVNRSKLLQIVD